MKSLFPLARAWLLLFPLYLFCKIIRPRAVAGDAPQFVKIFLFSFPNFYQAITGVFVLTGVGFWINARLPADRRVQPRLLYATAVIATGIFVFAQELNILRLRAHQTYDPYDLLFSLIGLATSLGIILYLRPHNR